MKLETSQTFGNTTYLLSDKELAALIAEAGNTVSRNSPLQKIDLSRIARTPPDEAAELGAALDILSHPARTVELRTWPDGGDWVRYYGAADSANLVMHARNDDTGANMIIWPLTPGMLKGVIAVSLASGRKAAPVKASFSLKFHEMLTLASLVDRQQEIVWRSFASRNSAPDIRFDAKAVQKAYSKGLKNNDDPRWMVSRLMRGLCTDLAPQLTSTEDTLKHFCNIGLLVEDVDGYAPLPSSELIFRQLADVESLSAITIQDHANPSPTRRLYHANHAQIWRYEFDGELDPQSNVRLEAISGQELSTDLEMLFPPTVTMPAGADAALSCPSCGAAASKGQSFCAKCGTKLEAEPKPAKAPDTCTQCGAHLEPGLKFCTQCGHQTST